MKISILITCYEGDHKIITDNLDDQSSYDIVLYNKKNNDFGINIENKGVDAYDKLHFIIKNYDNLPDIIIFSTDSMFTNSKKKKKIEFILKNINKLKNKSGFLTGHIIKLLPQEYTFKLDNYKGKDLTKATIRPFDNWFREFISRDIPIENIYNCKKSTFAVTKDLILSNPIEYYVKLFNEVKSHSKCGHDSEVPHYCERAWVEIFCKNNTSLMIHDFNEYGDL